MSFHGSYGPHDPKVYHSGSRFTQYRTYIKTLRNRLRYVEDKEIEWKRQHPGGQPASYYKTERDTIRWVLELVNVFVPEEHRPSGAPIPVLADECPECHAAMTRRFDGLKRVLPWTCGICGHQYPATTEELEAQIPSL